MAKSKMSKVAKDVKPVSKIADKQLQELKELQLKLNNILLNLGNAEVAKQSMLTAHIGLKLEWETMTKSLEEEYGQVNISLEDGTISPIEEE